MAPSTFTGPLYATTATSAISLSVAVSKLLLHYPVLSAQAVRYAIGAAALLAVARLRHQRLPRPTAATWRCCWRWARSGWPGSTACCWRRWRAPSRPRSAWWWAACPSCSPRWAAAGPPGAVGAGRGRCRGGGGRRGRGAGRRPGHRGRAGRGRRGVGRGGVVLPAGGAAAAAAGAAGGGGLRLPGRRGAAGDRRAAAGRPRGVAGPDRRRGGRGRLPGSGGHRRAVVAWYAALERLGGTGRAGQRPGPDRDPGWRGANRHRHRRALRDPRGHAGGHRDRPRSAAPPATDKEEGRPCSNGPSTR
jgi:hypothetical protein